MLIRGKNKPEIFVTGREQTKISVIDASLDTTLQCCPEFLPGTPLLSPAVCWVNTWRNQKGKEVISKS
jgi:hypothetical protein